MFSFIFQILVAKSPIAPFANFVYTVEASGIVLKGMYASLENCMICQNTDTWVRSYEMAPERDSSGIVLDCKTKKLLFIEIIIQ